ncbi:bleomycin resistance protein [Arthrobacter sp. ERGS1:01]|uniref:VOC family protein n=1 Tax=Arthrobacter sp. ERGS1:01 TaxID=1704044 RepID=UPI0006B4B573|nr:glyoxalase/bleomycin resistance/extradiol dioxygenase family protein [Arthrobacter sp. ERGS1:01]ALE06285.1 bleomycin resistance protein [Arthrobacter sp. ERGS1:01]
MADVVNYFEIGSPDPVSSRTFYGSLFDWGFGEQSPVGYQMVNSDQGGLWDTASMGGQAWAIFYVQVEDVKAAITRAEALGASIAVPFVDNGAIEFAHLVDPQGNRFGVWRPKGQA